ncbi:type II secretion system protein [Variovorax robiniae]|uniref:Type II secretion system protein n=1 Tax=Variovorax robiniae TaxID=1836199 RepID=A0ABU8X6M5_9BURK
MRRTFSRMHERGQVPRLRKAQRGFTLIWALMTVFILGIYLGEVGTLWGTEIARDKEEVLLHQGDEIREAIRRYMEAGGAAGGMQYPRKLDDLVKDPRVPFERRFLRKAYKDPMTGKDWSYIGAPGGGIMGVYSSASGTPFKQEDFPKVYSSFTRQTSYEGWKFAHYPGSAGLRR